MGENKTAFICYDIMNLILVRVLFFGLVPVGIFILVKTIGLLKGVFNGKLIAEIAFTQKEVTFKIAQPGVYAVWQKGQLFRKTPIDKFHLRLTTPLGEEVPLPRSFFSPHLNGFDTARIEMNRFSAERGTYQLHITEGSGASVFEKLALSLLPAKSVDYSQYFFQIRESRPVYYIMAATPLFILSAFFHNWWSGSWFPGTCYSC